MKKMKTQVTKAPQKLTDGHHQQRKMTLLLLKLAMRNYMRGATASLAGLNNEADYSYNPMHAINNYHSLSLV